MTLEAFFAHVLHCIKKVYGSDYEKLPQDVKESVLMIYAGQAMQAFPEIRNAVAQSVYEELRGEPA